MIYDDEPDHNSKTEKFKADLKSAAKHNRSPFYKNTFISRRMSGVNPIYNEQCFDDEFQKPLRTISNSKRGNTKNRKNKSKSKSKKSRSKSKPKITNIEEPLYVV